MTTYTVTIEQDNWGELLLPIPEEILEEMNWTTGTVLDFIDNKDGTFSLVKATPSPLDDGEPVYHDQSTTHALAIDDMLLHMLGSHELVKIWWNSPNKHFDYEKPCNCNREQVYEYVLSHSSYPG